MLTITSCRNHETKVFRNVSNHSFLKCLQLQFPEILAVIISEILAIICVRNVGDKCIGSCENGDEC